MSAEASNSPSGGSKKFYALVALILLALPAGWYLFLSRPELPPPPPPPPVAVTAPEVAQPVELKVSQVEGTVEVRRADGTWTPVSEGASLQRSDAVRTLDGSVAVLVGGEAYEIRMEAGTEVSVDDLTASISRILLQNGMATAKVKGQGKHTFEVRAAGSDSVARTQNAEFAISNNGQGTVAVGTRSGEVEFSGSGKVVIVRAGQQSIVRPGEGPSAPTSVPSSLLLKVNWPKATVITRKRVVVAGETIPGSHVQVAGKVVRADANGRFSEQVTLNEGRNRLEVRAVSVGGVRSTSDADLKVDTRVDRIGIDRDIWGTTKPE